MRRQSAADVPERTPDRPGIIAPPPLIYVSGLIAALILDAAVPVGLPVPRPASVAIGVASLALGGLLVGSAFRAFRRAATNVNPYRPATALVLDGPFRYTRNPMYLSLTLLYFGVGMLLRTAWPAVLLPLIVVIMCRGVISREERYLAHKFGAAYEDYRRSVRRWI